MEIPRRWDYDEICAAHDESGRTNELLDQLKIELTSSVECGALIVQSRESNQPRVVFGSVDNQDLIPNLPQSCCVEVTCLVDGNGIQPTAVGPLPPQRAAVDRTNVNVQQLAVEAVLSKTTVARTTRSLREARGRKARILSPWGGVNRSLSREIESG